MDPRLELTAALIERFNSGDLEHFTELLDPAVEVHTDLMVNPGTHRGRDGYLAWAARWMDAWSD